MMKRTSVDESKTKVAPTANEATKTLLIEYVGPDIPGTLNSVTEFLAQQNVDISTLKTDAFHDDDDDTTKHATYISVRLSADTEISEFTNRLKLLCKRLKQDLTIKSTELIG